MTDYINQFLIKLVETTWPFQITRAEGINDVQSPLHVFYNHMICVDTDNALSSDFKRLLGFANAKTVFAYIASSAFKYYKQGQNAFGLAKFIENDVRQIKEDFTTYPPYVSYDISRQEYVSLDYIFDLWMIQAMIFGGKSSDRDNMIKAFTKGTPVLFLCLMDYYREFADENPNFRLVESLIREIYNQLTTSDLPITEDQKNQLADYFLEAGIDSDHHRLFLLEKQLDELFGNLIEMGIQVFIWPIGNLSGIAGCPVDKVFSVLARSFSRVYEKASQKNIMIIVTNAPTKETENVNFFNQLVGSPSDLPTLPFSLPRATTSTPN
jgi:hypothetical protein